jgi:hypothetical protein
MPFLVELLIMVVILALFLHVIYNYLPIDQTIKNLISILLVILIVVYFLRAYWPRLS